MGEGLAKEGGQYKGMIEEGEGRKNNTNDDWKSCKETYYFYLHKIICNIFKYIFITHIYTFIHV